MNKIISWFCKIFIKPIVKILFIKEVKGWKNIPKRNFILASNHQSHLDWIIDPYICVPRRFTFIGQVDRYTGTLGVGRNILYSIAGVIPVNRKKEESRKKAIEKAIEALKRGHILIIYPEGTRTRNGKIGEGKPGIAKIFLKSRVPILSVGIRGTFELMPPGTGFPKIKREVKINIGKPLFFEEELEKAKNLAEDSIEYQEILEKITQKVMEEIASLVERA